MTQHTRQNPSLRYQELVALYRTMHIEGEQFLNVPPEETFPGFNLLREAPRIKRLIQLTASETILDYGSGKGQQYEVSPVLIAGEKWPSVVEYWDISEVQCYDPAYLPFSTVPTQPFDGVVSTDVLEHCPEEDIHWILDEMFCLAKNFVYANIACYPAKTRLPTGENAHCTIKDPTWWQEHIRAVIAVHPNVLCEIWLQSIDPSNPDQFQEIKLGNS